MVYRKDLPIARLLDTRMLRRLGLVSGSYYVLHTVVGGLLAALLAMLGLALAVAPFTLVALCVTFAIATVTYSLVEAPGIELGKKVNRQLLGSPMAIRSAA